MDVFVVVVFVVFVVFVVIVVVVDVVLWLDLGGRDRVYWMIIQAIGAQRNTQFGNESVPAKLQATSRRY